MMLRFLFLLVFILLNSCSAVKRVKDGEHLLTDNTIIVDDKVIKTERVNNIPLQKPNATIPLLNTPLRLHVYNLARPNIDSIIHEDLYGDPKKARRRIRLLSKKQVDRLAESRKAFNSWLKRTGEAPTILNDAKTEKSKNRLRSYYFQNGWFNNVVNTEVVRDSNKRAEVTYKVTKGQPYMLDTLKTFISTPAIDSIYKGNTTDSFIKKGDQYKEENYEKERSRINEVMRNSGVYHFGTENVSFVLDTIGFDNAFNAELYINDRTIRGLDSTRVEPFKIYKIKEVNIFTDYSFENQTNKEVSDSTTYEGYNIYSFDKLRFRPQALTDAVFIKEGDLYKDINRTRTSRYINRLQMFRFPDIEYIENPEDTTLTANIRLSPLKKYNLGFSFDVSQSNIQTIGFAFSTGLKIRNVFKGAEVLNISALGSIGASKDSGDPNDPFFDINEFGGTIGLTMPRFYFPFNTERIIPKYMSPTTTMNISATSQTNIGLDKQNLSSIFGYNWLPSETVSNSLELFNIQFVKNLNTSNYFGVYGNSYNRLNNIARNINYIGNTDDLTIPEGTNMFIDDVLSNNTSLNPSDTDYVTVNNIDQRRDRLTEDNLIISTSFDYKKDKRESIFDNNFSTFKFHLEVAGNILSAVSDFAGVEKNENDRYEVFGVAFSQYFKAELDYIKYFETGGKSVLAFRSYFGVAIPYGNSGSIPFVESFFGGGPNDNRAWTAYNLGPGSSQNTNEFSEANLKLHFSLEQRFNLFGRFYGALFADAGNIWNAFGNVNDDPPSTFNNLSSLKDIAVGSGFGVRYDFTFFVFRFDVGFKTYDPSKEVGNRWFTDYNFRNAVYNIGINYPF